MDGYGTTGCQQLKNKQVVDGSQKERSLERNFEGDCDSVWTVALIMMIYHIIGWELTVEIYNVIFS